MASSNSSRFWRPKKGCRGGNLPRTHPGSCARVYLPGQSSETAFSAGSAYALSVLARRSALIDINLRAYMRRSSIGVAL